MMLRVALVLASIHAQTPPPASGPAEPSPPACADDASWHKTIMALALILFVMICIGALCNRRQKEQRSNQRALEMSNRQSSYEPPVVQGERVPTPMGRVPPSKLDSPRGAVV